MNILIKKKRFLWKKKKKNTANVFSLILIFQNLVTKPGINNDCDLTKPIANLFLHSLVKNQHLLKEITNEEIYPSGSSYISDSVNYCTCSWNSYMHMRRGKHHILE